MGNCVLFLSLISVSIKGDAGWRIYLINAIIPVMAQVIMLVFLGLMAGQMEEFYMYILMLLDIVVSFYLIYRSFRNPARNTIGILIVCSQIYAVILANFIGIMAANNDWL